MVIITLQDQEEYLIPGLVTLPCDDVISDVRVLAR